SVTGSARDAGLRRLGGEGDQHQLVVIARGLALDLLAQLDRRLRAGRRVTELRQQRVHRAVQRLERGLADRSLQRRGQALGADGARNRTRIAGSHLTLNFLVTASARLPCWVSDTVAV